MGEPNRLLRDGAYDSAEFLGWMVDDKKIAPHVTLLETPGRPTQSFTQKEFFNSIERQRPLTFEPFTQINESVELVTESDFGRNQQLRPKFL